MTNTYTLSPLAKNKASEVMLNGKATKRDLTGTGFMKPRKRPLTEWWATSDIMLKPMLTKKISSRIREFFMPA